MSTPGRGGRCPFVALFFLAAASPAQDREPVPVFPSEAEAITVDVVVLDGDGRPIRGLKKADFTVLEDGKPQDVVGFEVRDLAAPRPPEAAAEVVAGLPRAEGEEAGGRGGRTLAFIIDDLGMDGRSTAALESIREWIRSTSDPRDELTLVTTSGEVDWTGRVGTGRGELLRALSRIRCQRPGDGFFEGMTEWQAYQRASGRPDWAILKGHEPQGGAAASRTGRDVASGGGSMKASEIYDWWRRRAAVIVSAIESFSLEHASERGRKPVFVFSQTFIRDDDLKQADQAVDASRRGNTAVYFVDTRGLVAGDAFGDEVREVSLQMDLAGAEQIALATGGDTIRDTNDILGGLARAVDESSAYYLLGYQPTRAPDGQWRKLEVRVGIEGVKVRARRGYYASKKPLSEQPDVIGTPITPPPPSSLAGAGPSPDPAGAPSDPGSRAAAQPGAASPTGRRAAREEAAPSVPSTAAPPTPSAVPPTEGQVPVFETLAEAITVDVVVLNEAGRPVTDLAQGEFTLLEDGRPQSIVGFEPRALVARREAEDAAEPDDGLASNERPRTPSGRTLAFLIDDLGIEPLRMTEAAKALSRWLVEGADPRDEVTLVTSSGDAWWSARVGEGRGDLEAVLGRIKGQKRLASGQQAMSDFEAYSIDTYGSPVDPADRVPGGGPPTAGSGACTNSSPSSSVLDRVVDRWFRTMACICDSVAPDTSIRSCRGQAMARAREVYGAATQRALGLLGGVERLSRGLTAARGRKSLVVLSEGLLRDTDQRAFERAVDASRRANTSVSFVDVRGLVALPFYGADQTAPPKPGDLGTLTAEATLLETAGGEYLAETTGGTTVRDTNDIAGGVARLADEASSYYLLGYQTDRPLDGKWRKLDVKVARPGLRVRARRGYFATKAAAPMDVQKAPKKKGRKKGKAEDLPVRLLDPALAVGGERDGIPLRIAPYVFETDASRTARVLVAVEVGTTSLTFSGKGAQRTAKLDVTILGVSRDQPRTVPLDSHVELSLDAQATGGWWIFSRELRLPPGAAQIRTLVRDTVSGRSGLVAQRIDIPSPDAPYLSTPILTNRLRSTAAPGVPRIVPTASRTFPARGELFCAYEVYVAPASDPRVIPKVAGGYTLEDEAGRIVASAPPTPIAMALGAQIVRLFSIPLRGLASGRYRLTIQTADDSTGLSLEAREFFRVEAPETSGPTPN